ncbi:MAG TPA: YceI family protein [Candidatus Limnocylindrales bacterium]
MTTRSSPTTALSRPHRNRNVLLVLLGVLVVAGIAGGAYGLWYILVGPSAPTAVGSAPALPSGAGVAAPASLDGTWSTATSLGNVDAGTATFVGYRVQEQLVGVGGHTAVGRTAKVTGSLSLSGSIVDNVQITADMTALVSDSGQRDNQLKRQAIETDNFPTSFFKTIAPIDLGTLPGDGATVHATTTGALTLHGVTKTVTIDLSVQRQGGIIAVAGSLPIVFADWSIAKPNSFSVLSIDDHGIMEFHLLFTHT